LITLFTHNILQVRSTTRLIHDKGMRRPEQLRARP
jgi:hypothetical protein